MHCMITMHAHPRQTNVMATARQFVLPNASRGKKGHLTGMAEVHLQRMVLVEQTAKRLVLVVVLSCADVIS